MGTFGCRRRSEECRGKTVSRILSSPRTVPLSCERGTRGMEAVIPLGGSLPIPSSSLPRRTSGRCISSLFGLASDRVYRAVCVTTTLVGSYPTVSSLPNFLRNQAVCFLLHLPSSCLAWSLTSILPYEVRTFLSAKFAQRQPVSPLHSMLPVLCTGIFTVSQGAAKTGRQKGTKFPRSYRIVWDLRRQQYSPLYAHI